MLCAHYRSEKESKPESVLRKKIAAAKAPEQPHHPVAAAKAPKKVTAGFCLPPVLLKRAGTREAGNARTTNTPQKEARVGGGKVRGKNTL